MVSKIASRLDSIYHPFSKVDVLCYKSSYEIVMITCVCIDVDKAFFLQVISSLFIFYILRLNQCKLTHILCLVAVILLDSYKKCCDSECSTRCAA